jgi:imidazolonepropionase-like amidohydrolase
MKQFIFAPQKMALIAAALAALAGPAIASTTAIVGATIYSADQSGVIRDGTLIMKDGRISAIGKGLPVPAGATVINAAGKIVTPGLIAPLSGIGVTEVDGVAPSNDRPSAHKRYGAAMDMADAYNPRSMRIATTRVDGVTSAMVSPLSSKSGSVLAGLGAVASLGAASEWRLKTQAAMFGSLGEQGAGIAGSRASAMLALREMFEEARSGVKPKTGPEKESLLSTLDIAALRLVLSGKIPLVLAANRASDIEAAIELSQKYKFRLVIEGGAEAWLVAKQLALNKVAVIVDPELVLPVNFESLGARPDNAKLLIEAGVLVAFTSDETAATNTRNLRFLAGNAIGAGGVEPQAALAAVTINPARIFGVAHRVGSLAVGKQADVVVWDSDPFELDSYPDAVYIRGEKMPRQSRPTDLRDKYLKALPR